MTGGPEDRPDGARSRAFGDAAARALLRRLAPRDAAVAWSDLAEERRRSLEEGSGRIPATLALWAGVLAVCAWAARDRVLARPRSVRPLQALRLAVRGLRRTPGIAVTAALTLGLGLTATVSVLGIHYGSTRPLPGPDGEEIVAVRVLDARSRPVPPPPGALDLWRRSAGLDGVGGVVATGGGTLVSDAGPALRVSVAAMEPEAFRVLGVRPLRGRLPSGSADDSDAVLLGEELWTGLFDRAPGAVGSVVRLDGRSLTVIGIMPADFGFPENQGAWTVLAPSEGALPGRAEVVGRLAEGRDAGGVRRTLEAELARLPVPGGLDGPLRVRVASWSAGRGEGGELWMLAALGALVGLLLVVCAANVSTLLLVRARERVSTLAVHSALGAGRAQVALQLFFEALLVSLAGGAVGIVGGWAVIRWMEAALSEHWGYYWMRMELRPEVLLGTVGAVLAAASLAGTAPALTALRTDLRSAMTGRSGQSGHSGARGGLRWFVRLQVALSTMALVAAAVMARGFMASGELADSLPLDRVALGTVAVDTARYSDPASRITLARDLRSAVASLPDVVEASVSRGIPGFPGGRSTLELHLPGGAGEPLRGRVTWIGVDDHTTDTFGLDLVAGRPIDAADVAEGRPVVVVNRSFAERWGGGGTALGATLAIEGVHGPSERATVVGVVEDHLDDRPGARADRVYVPLGSVAPASFHLSARTGGDAARTASLLRDAVASVDPALPVEEVRTLGGFVAWLLRIPRTVAGFGAAGGLAGVLVAAIGLYGLVAFRVRVGLRDVGIRLALGAPASRVLREIVVGSVLSVAPAVVAGLGLALLASPALAMFSFGVPVRDPALFALCALGMGLVAALAALRPALRAARLEPDRVLREE